MILWWFLRFALEAKGNPEESGHKALSALCRALDCQKWSIEAATILACSCKAAHTAAKLLHGVGRSHKRWNAKSEKDWGGFVDCIPGVYALRSKLKTSPSDQNDANSIDHESLNCYEIDAVGEDDSTIRAVKLAVSEDAPRDFLQHLIPTAEALMEGDRPVKAQKFGLDSANALGGQDFHVIAPRRSTQARINCGERKAVLSAASGAQQAESSIVTSGAQQTESSSVASDAQQAESQWNNPWAIAPILILYSRVAKRGWNHWLLSLISPAPGLRAQLTIHCILFAALIILSSLTKIALIACWSKAIARGACSASEFDPDFSSAYCAFEVTR